MSETISISLRPCSCRYQREYDWKYDVQRWTGGKRSWKHLATVNLGDAAVLAAKHKLVLIRCNGCGNELMRVPGELLS